MEREVRSSVLMEVDEDELEDDMLVSFLLFESCRERQCVMVC